MKKMLAPSILSADFGNLRQEVINVVNAGADLIHVDCMDNHFVPNLTIGPVVLASLKGCVQVPFDVHLMVTDPATLVMPFVQAGANMISVQVEADVHLQRTLELIKSQGVQAGVVLNPATPLVSIENVLPWCDFILIMTVNPGFAGQSFIRPLLTKIQAAHALVSQSGFDIQSEVDGGVKLDNVQEIFQAGADIVVAGSAVFGAADPATAVAEFTRIARQCAAQA
jgi:ribulose-phosphate 3-epimerase